jgi:signal transduction histidine kinase/CheY-like chemotaxis protein
VSASHNWYNAGVKGSARALEEQIERMTRQQAAIVALACRKPYRVTNLETALREIAEVAASTLSVQRTSVWKLSKDRQQLECLVLHDGDRRDSSGGEVLLAKDYPRYFAALGTNRAIDANDAVADPRTSEFKHNYLEKYGITSMLDAGVRDEGHVVGVVCIEHASTPRIWRPDEVAFAGAMADQAAMIFAAAERHQLEDDRERMRHQLLHTQRLESMGTLAAGVAHEINNPLAYVTASLDFVAGEVRSAASEVPGRRWQEMEEAIRDARQGVDRVRRIVRDLKTFSRSDDEQRGPVDLRKIIESTLNMVWNEIRHRARLVKDYGPDVPLVEANESGLAQVFLNLLLNAAQVLEEGRADKNEIRIATRTHGSNMVAVEVRDTGPGMTEAVMGRVFDPFFTTKPIGVGTGLGLSISHNIVTSLGGLLQVESKLGEGSTFRVVIPVARTLPVLESAPTVTLPAAVRGRVLIIDDEPRLIGALRRVLEEDHDVEGLTSAREALAALTSSGGPKYDVILCDLMMPEMTGMDLHTELVRVNPETAERMVFLTGGVFTPKARAFLDQVANARLEKPLDSQNLRVLIRDRLRVRE